MKVGYLAFYHYRLEYKRADTYRRLFERISPTAFEQSFQSWLSSLLRDLGGQVIPIDGKTLRGSYDRNGEQCPYRQCS